LKSELFQFLLKLPFRISKPALRVVEGLHLRIPLAGPGEFLLPRNSSAEIVVAGQRFTPVDIAVWCIANRAEMMSEQVVKLNQIGRLVLQGIHRSGGTSSVNIVKGRPGLLTDRASVVTDLPPDQLMAFVIARLGRGLRSECRCRASDLIGGSRCRLDGYPFLSRTKCRLAMARTIAWDPARKKRRRARVR
jgi:hypothetical protein